MPVGKNLPLKAQKAVTCSANPVPDPKARFNVIGLNQRCLEAQLAPLRRHLTEGDQRALRPGTFPTADECYAECSLLGYTLPFNFNLYKSSAGNDCYCCQTCTLTPASGYSVRGLGVIVVDV